MGPNMAMSTSCPPMMPGAPNAPVAMVPAMMDKSCGTSPVHHRMTPMRMMMDDMRVMMRNLGCLPDMMMSMWSMEFGMSMFMTWMDMRDCCLQVMLMMVECCAMMLCLPTMLYMPGIVSMTMGCLFAGCVMMLAMPMNRDMIMRCQMPDGHGIDEFSDEKWICINGSMTRWVFFLRSE
jgi:hypothetical protein